ncbi:isopentenyl-diphosphate delta-isomerase [marine actinobacterium PHSC20C1]|nr:isopentenyl-diphosphate delta-isomerase [marine actinobacterium PHSC20C1]
MTDIPEQVVLLSDAGDHIGVADKARVHTKETALHLAFSCHIYNAEGEVLVTRRALSKLTWPGVWTNSFCGHPSPGEDMADAITRRAKYELGIAISELQLVLPDFRYRAVDSSGIVENEICPVYRAVTADEIAPNPDEVAEFDWVDPQSLHSAVAATPFAFSPWLGWQLEQLDAR